MELLLCYDIKQSLCLRVQIVVPMLWYSPELDFLSCLKFCFLIIIMMISIRLDRCVQIIVPMRLFSPDQIINAQRRHAIHKTGNLESRVNPNRGL